MGRPGSTPIPRTVTTSDKSEGGHEDFECGTGESVGKKSEDVWSEGK